MKLKSHSALRSNFGIINNMFKPTRNKTRKGMSVFKSKLEEITGAEKFDPREIGLTKSGAITHASRSLPVRVACVKRVSGGYRVIGRTGGILPVTFGELKAGLRNLNYTGIRMGAINVSL